MNTGFSRFSLKVSLHDFCLPGSLPRGVPEKDDDRADGDVGTCLATQSHERLLELKCHWECRGADFRFPEGCT